MYLQPNGVLRESAQIWTLHPPHLPFRRSLASPRGDGSMYGNPLPRRTPQKKLSTDAVCRLKVPSRKCYTREYCHFGRLLRDADPPYDVRRQVTCANSGQSLERLPGVGGEYSCVERSCNAGATGGPSGAEAIAFRWYEMRCPYCGSAELLRSRSVDPWYLWLLRPLLVPIRCGRCTRRFHRARLRTFFASNVHSF
jgi:hypothetical protein